MSNEKTNGTLKTYKNIEWQISLIKVGIYNADYKRPIIVLSVTLWTYCVLQDEKSKNLQCRKTRGKHNLLILPNDILSIFVNVQRYSTINFRLFIEVDKTRSKIQVLSIKVNSASCYFVRENLNPNEMYRLINLANWLTKLLGGYMTKNPTKQSHFRELNL